jgi:toxin HigB-1
VIARRLDHIDVVETTAELGAIPGSRLEKLKGKLRDYWSLRINDQYRIVFHWDPPYASDVRVTDYH